MKTSIEYGLTHPEVGEPLREYIKALGKELEAEDHSVSTNMKKRLNQKKKINNLY